MRLGKPSSALVKRFVGSNVKNAGWFQTGLASISFLCKCSHAGPLVRRPYDLQLPRQPPCLPLRDQTTRYRYSLPTRNELVPGPVKV